MGKHDHCCVGGCSNDRRYPESISKRSHVDTLQWFGVRGNEEKRQLWEKQIKKGRADFRLGTHMTVCSNHFADAKPTPSNPHPTLFMTQSDADKRSPQKRKSRVNLNQTSPPRKKGTEVNNDDTLPGPDTTAPAPLSTLTFTHITRETDVRCFTGFRDGKTFKFVHEHLQQKADHMLYWKGKKQTFKERTATDEFTKPGTYQRRGPSRKLSSEQEFLLVMMRLRMCLTVPDLAFRFQVSSGLVSQIFATWIRLMAKELKWLVIWPSKVDIRKSLPDSFVKWFPKVRTIIDCTEVFIETPSSLDVQAMCWSEYKHHSTIKFLVAISPCGLIMYVSPCYGGRASDKHIVKDSGFLDFLEPYDHVMADRGFKIHDELAPLQVRLTIPPSASNNLQMRGEDVKSTSRIANVRIYVEKAIARIKWYRILGSEMEMPLLALCDDIVITCCALCNLLDPLTTQ